MEKEEKGVMLAPCGWSPAVETLLATAVQDATLPDIRRQVERSTAQVFSVKTAGDLLAAFVLRVDECAGGHDGVIVAAAGNGQGINLTAACLPAIEKLFVNCKRIRIHTARPGLGRQLVKDHNYELKELVFVKELQ